MRIKEALQLRKAKYIKRWKKGADGKWRYEYKESKGKKLSLKNTSRFVEIGVGLGLGGDWDVIADEFVSTIEKLQDIGIHKLSYLVDSRFYSGIEDVAAKELQQVAAGSSKAQKIIQSAMKNMFGYISDLKKEDPKQYNLLIKDIQKLKSKKKMNEKKEVKIKQTEIDSKLTHLTQQLEAKFEGGHFGWENSDTAEILTLLSKKGDLKQHVRDWVDGFVGSVKGVNKNEMTSAIYNFLLAEKRKSLKKAFQLRKGSEVVKVLTKEGKSKNRPDSDFDKKALAAGTKVELEHTSSRQAAKEIAKDHLVEDPKYYDRLSIMEGEGKYSTVEKKLLKWFKDHPNPTDKQVHAFANKMKIDEHKLEEIIYKLTTEHAQMVMKKAVSKRAMRHKDVLGAGAKKRKRLSAKDKFDTIMAEFERGTLRSGSGEVVTDKGQALAIAYSESGLKKSKRVAFTKSNRPMLGVEVLKKKPVREALDKKDAFGEDLDEEPTMYEEAAIEVMLRGKVPKTYSRALHDL